MQHARISVKHLTTVLMLAAKLIQSSSVVNTGIWTKPRQPGERQRAWPSAGSCRGCTTPGASQNLFCRSGCHGRGGTQRQQQDHQGQGELPCCQGRNGSGEPPGKSHQPLGSCDAPSTMQGAALEPACSAPGSSNPFPRGRGNQTDQHRSQSLPRGSGPPPCQSRRAPPASTGVRHRLEPPWRCRVPRVPAPWLLSRAKPGAGDGNGPHNMHLRPLGPATHTVLLPTLFILLIFQ